MITLIDFLDLSMDDWYKINIYSDSRGGEIIHQKTIDYIKDTLADALLYSNINSWDIDTDNIKELCINID